jgi:putative FmdB family regulatory protein
VPTYGYRCNNCNHTFEVFQKITEEPIAECEKCKGEVKRILYPVGVVFKGSGFHINDYAKPDRTEPKEEKSPTPAPVAKPEIKETSTASTE